MTLRSLRICGLDVSAVSLSEAADAMVDYCRSDKRRSAEVPLFITSVNGQVLSLCAKDPQVRTLFTEADIIHCDGQPLVLLSRLLGEAPLPERVATTDLFPEVAARAERSGMSFYLLGGTCEVSRKLRAMLQASYPKLAIVGACHGYLKPEDEAKVVAEIARLKPDVLWIGMGVPLEQRFVMRHRAALRGVGIVKTSGGLFDFMSESVGRAPLWMQKAGLEWLFRLLHEPKRLFWRYAISNPHALYIMIQSLLSNRAASHARIPEPPR